ncbi:hypothetical protein ABIB82_000582 [Bradyrhizobium sp. i1.8.4]|uniref:hypothetical protein n=1 Tax=unclassified Bradyrhizobium TaxID=2631580 RepID=UPI003D1D81A8
MLSLKITPPIAFLSSRQNTIQPVLEWDVRGQGSVCFWYKANNKGKWRPAIFDTDDPNTPRTFSNATGSSYLGIHGTTEGRDLGVGRYVFLGYLDATMNPNSDPTLTDPEPLVRAELAVLRDSATLLQDLEDWGNTGTQIDAFAHGIPAQNSDGHPIPGGGKQTYAVLRVDTWEPQHPDDLLDGQPYPPGWSDFVALDPNSPDYVVPLTPPQPTAYDALALDHLPIAIASRYFLPGQPYWALLLVYTEDGEWQVKKKQLTMHHRRVEITFREISITDDGCDGDGRAYFHWWVVDQDLIARFYRTGTIPISDRPSPGEEWKEHVALSTYIPEQDTPLVLGPYSVTENKYNRCCILTRAIVKHATDIDGKSGNIDAELGAVGTAAPDVLSLQAFLEFRIGADVETFEGVRFTIPAENVNPDDDNNEFAYEIRGLYSVDYVPVPHP